MPPLHVRPPRLRCLLLLVALAACAGPKRHRARWPIAQERISGDAPERLAAPEGVSAEDRADVLRAAIAWVLDDARGASAGAAKRLDKVIVLADDLKSEPPAISGVDWLPLRLIEELVREKKHAFVYVIVSEVYRQREVFEVAIALRQIWVDGEGNPEHAPLGAENTVLEFIRTPSGMERVLSPTGK